MAAVTPPDAPAERRIVVTGQVQGVGYRWFARETARALGVTGWVRNMPDGTVVLEVRAPEAVVLRFAAALRVGPVSARVEDVVVHDRADGVPLPARFVVVR
jgi:acylphosphatase